jgi:hypothetical protein
MLMRMRPQRLLKKMKAVFGNGTGIIENISATGGFLKTDHEIPDKAFGLNLKLMGFKTIKINCAPQWNNEYGVGFKILNIENTKQEFFNQYMGSELTKPTLR